MEKIIKISGKELKLNNNVAWAMEYKAQFGKDILPAIMPLFTTIMESATTILADAEYDAAGSLNMQNVAEALEGRALDILLPLYQADFVELVVNVTWALAKAADPGIDPPEKWVRQFDEFPLDIIVPEVFGLVAKGFVSSKNLKRLKTAGASMKKTVASPQPSR